MQHYDQNTLLKKIPTPTDEQLLKIPPNLNKNIQLVKSNKDTQDHWPAAHLKKTE